MQYCRHYFECPLMGLSLHFVQLVAEQVVLAIVDWFALAATDGCGQTVLAQMADLPLAQPVVEAEEEPLVPVAHSLWVSSNCRCRSPRGALLVREMPDRAVPHCGAAGLEVMVG